MKNKAIFLLFMLLFSFINYAAAEINLFLSGNKNITCKTRIKGYVLYVSPDNVTIIFSLLPYSKEKNLDNIFITKLDTNNKIWSVPKKINFIKDNILTPGKHTGNTKEILLTIYDKHGKSDIYSCLFSDETFYTPVKLGTNINSKFIEKNACLSEDRSTIYFASNRKGGYGGLDLYKSEKLESGDWGRPQNLGPKINSSSDEDFPIILSDDVTLHFSSIDHKTIRRFDNFYTILNEDGLWSETENVCTSINYKGDDLYGYFTTNGKKFFYSTTANSLSQTVIYIFELPNSQHNLTIKN